MLRKVGYLLILVGVSLLISVFYMLSPFSRTTRPFSPYTLLTSSWEKYKERFVNGDGRVIDDSQGDLTTSEGQSYALLRSVWIDDKETFDRVWQWTKNNLRRSDGLFSWRWGRRPDGSYGVIPEGGENSASDADSDISLALILAQRRWNDPSYLDDVRQILNSLWEVETEEVLGKRYLIAGSWAKGDKEAIINPSYFAPYAWRLFDEVDGEHDWQSLIDPSYEILRKATEDSLDKERSANLPPDWLSLDRENGSLRSTGNEALTTNFSYDAMRVSWRIALDYQWNGEPRAMTYLTLLGKLEEEYRQRKRLAAAYSHDGLVIQETESPAMYGASLGYFLVVHPELAEGIYQERITRLYSNDTNSFGDDLLYYEENWIWFGMALYHKRLGRF